MRTLRCADTSVSPTSVSRTLRCEGHFGVWVLILLIIQNLQHIFCTGQSSFFLKGDTVKFFFSFAVFMSKVDVIFLVMFVYWGVKEHILLQVGGSVWGAY